MASFSSATPDAEEAPTPTTPLVADKPDAETPVPATSLVNDKAPVHFSRILFFLTVVALTFAPGVVSLTVGIVEDSKWDYSDADCTGHTHDDDFTEEKSTTTKHRHGREVFYALPMWMIVFGALWITMYCMVLMYLKQQPIGLCAVALAWPTVVILGFATNAFVRAPKECGPIAWYAWLGILCGLPIAIGGSLSLPRALGSLTSSRAAPAPP